MEICSVPGCFIEDAELLFRSFSFSAAILEEAMSIFSVSVGVFCLSSALMMGSSYSSSSLW